MTQQQSEYALECLKRMENDLSGNRIDARSDLLKAFKGPMNWCVESVVPTHLLNQFKEINTLVTSKEKTLTENSFKRSIDSLNQSTCEKIVSDLNHFILQYEIYVIRNRT